MPVIRRKVTEELLDLISDAGALLATRGKSVVWAPCFPSNEAYYNAARRLRESGLVTCVTRRGEPVLRLTKEGAARVSPLLQKKRPWKKQWNGVWYMLIYDIPENDRMYRDHLRRFLKKMRLGCLQLSVWITPRDIRPEYADLTHAAGIADYAHLFATQSVLDQRPEDLVLRAWDMPSLRVAQSAYCKTYTEAKDDISSGRYAQDELIKLARKELRTFHIAMENDPLLPIDLWPADYLGEQAWKLHKSFTKALCGRL